MNFHRSRRAADRRSAFAASLQQRAEPADTRQQQQDNGTHEFQPSTRQMDAGDWDEASTLQGYLRQAAQRGELPRAANAPQSVRLSLAK